MASCYICDKHKIRGNNVSHAKNRTKRWFHPNLQRVKIVTQKGTKRVHVCTRCIRSNKIQKAI